MSDKLMIGAGVFARDIPENDERQWAEYLASLAKMGVEYAQFLMPKTAKAARRQAQIARECGIPRSGLLWCTFYPTCPCGEDGKGALDALKLAIECGNEMSEVMEGSPNVDLFSPSLFHGLGNAGGFPKDSDTDLQIGFLIAAMGLARGAKATLIVEPLNRFETNGPNTLHDAWDLVKKADAQGAIRLGLDSCHQLFEEYSVSSAWADNADNAGLIHASARSRGYLSDDAKFLPRVFAAVMRNAKLRRLPVVIEAFSALQTNPGFFPYLKVHRLPRVSALDVFSVSIACLKAWTGGS